MHTLYPSNPSMVNGFGGGGIGAGAGQDSSQSTHAHGNDLAYIRLNETPQTMW